MEVNRLEVVDRDLSPGGVDAQGAVDLALRVVDRVVGVQEVGDRSEADDRRNVGQEREGSRGQIVGERLEILERDDLRIGAIIRDHAESRAGCGSRNELIRDDSRPGGLRHLQRVEPGPAVEANAVGDVDQALRAVDDERVVAGEPMDGERIESRQRESLNDGAVQLDLNDAGVARIARHDKHIVVSGTVDGRVGSGRCRDRVPADDVHGQDVQGGHVAELTRRERGVHDSDAEAILPMAGLIAVAEEVSGGESRETRGAGVEREELAPGGCAGREIQRA